MRSAPPRVLALGALLLLLAASARAADPASSSSSPSASSPVQAELAVARRTREILEEKVAERRVVVRHRVRTLYKLTRGGLAPLWIDEQERARLVRNRAVARRVILRDLEEQALLREELARAQAAEDRLGAEAATAAVTETPLAAGSFGRPVPGRVVAHFGLWREPDSRAQLARNGIELACTPGDLVAAPAAGRILYAGPLRGLGTTVLLDHGDGVVSVTADLASAPLAVCADVARGATLGTALGRRLRFELRRAGRPLDPEPLLAK